MGRRLINVDEVEEIVPHRIEDLWLEKATLDIETGNVKILVGS